MPRVLVIEDSPTQARQLVFILEGAGFEVETAADADEGYTRLVQGRFDLVLSDLLLPGDSGFDLCRRIKANPAFRHLPVVVHTGQADPANVLRGLQAGADGFMTKDRPPEEIVGRIRRVLERGAAPPEAREPTRVVFRGQEFAFSAGRAQLTDILVAAFEDVLHLNELQEETTLDLCRVNVELQEANRTLADRNRQLQQLADELAATALSERQAHEELKRAESHLVQSEKLAALGQLVAGIAHEINNPLAFVSNNMAVLQRDVRALRDLIQLYQEADPLLAQHGPALRARIQDLAERLDLAYTLDNLEGLTTRSREGLKRIQQIVKDLRDFARLDESDLQEVDVNTGIESTLNLVRSQARKQQVELLAELGALPPITCFPAKVNQVVLNLLVNAIDACQAGGRVSVQTCPTATGIEIHVCDTGCGIDPAVASRVFDPFFTTKPPGQGTGLGLSISYQIVQAHGGSIRFESAPGQGTHFIVGLPLRPLPESARKDSP